MPLVFWMTSTSVEYTSRNATITDRMSMSGMRFSSRIRTVAQVMLRHAPGAVGHAHGAPLAGVAAGAAAAASVAGASPMEMSGNSSACTVPMPVPVSNTRTRSITCTSVS